MKPRHCFSAEKRCYPWARFCAALFCLFTARAEAETLVLTPSSMDQVVGERGSKGAPLGYHAGAAGATVFPLVGNEGLIGVGGAGGNINNRTHGNVVLGFALPTVPEGHAIVQATLALEVAARAGTPPDVDLYALGAQDAGFAPTSSSSTVLFRAADTDALQTKLVDNWITSASTNGTAGNALPKVFNADVFGFIDTLYAGGNAPVGGRQEAFFRLNASAPIALSNVSRYALANAASRLTLTLVTAPVVVLPPANLTLHGTKFGDTPSVLGYNVGTFMPGSNTADWWRYSGVNTARMFLSPNNFPAMTTNGVVDQAGFLGARASLRTNPLGSTWYSWATLEDRFANRDIGGFRVDHTVGTLRGLGVEMLMQISASEGSLPITSPADWTGKWALWKHYYAMAFHLGRHFDVRRYQTFNEPDHANANGLTPENWLMRLQLASDAVRCAVADVNALYGKSLTPLVYAPTTASASYTATWGGFAMQNRKVDFLGQSPSGFAVFDRYNYHNYNSNPLAFGQNVAGIRAGVAAAMPGEPVMPLAISEFNVHTGATFETTTETLDTPRKYSRFGAIAAQLTLNRLEEMFVFKFTQTSSTSASGVAKNGTHYADINNFPFNHGSPTMAAEAWRLFVKGFAPGREVLNYSTDGTLGLLSIIASRDPATGRHYIYSANDSASPVSLTIDVSAWSALDGARVTLEEVGPTGNGALLDGGYESIALGRIPSRVQPAYSVWLYSIETRVSDPDLVLTASDDALVKDGVNRTVNYGGSTRVYVKTDALNANARNAGLMRFSLPARYAPDLQLALLEMDAASLGVDAPAQAFVYGIDDSAWSEATVNWASVANLRQNVPAGNLIQHNVVADAGVSARVQGQLVVRGAAYATRQIDVTRHVRERMAAGASAAGFLVAQENRWDKNIETGVIGDTQGVGIQIVSKEGAGASGAGPRLRLVFHVDSDGDGLSDQAELGTFGTDADLIDTDGDDVSDGAEVLAGTDPLSP